jgi:putative endonuclease
MYKGGCVYIVTNKNNTVLYLGVTSNLKQRILDHQNKKYKNAFSAKYNCNKLVYFECFDSIVVALAREKQLKAGNRAKKLALINKINLNWEDLFESVKIN